jgi:hypothetical protein
MNARKLATWLLGAGVVLFVVALIWPFVLPDSAIYDDSQAIELSKASSSLHETLHAHGQAHGHGNDQDQFAKVPEKADPEVTAAAKRYRDAQSKLDSAKFWSSLVPAYLRWSALGLCAIGVVLFKGSRRQN